MRLRCGGGRFAGCMALAAGLQRAKGMEITGTESARKKQSNFENSLNRFADKCPLSGGKADMTLCGNPLSRSLSGVKRTCALCAAHVCF